MTIYTGIKKYAITFGLSLMLFGLGQNNAHALASMPDVPLLVFSSAEHNVLLTFDDSGSMKRGFLPDGLSGTQRRHCAIPGLFTAAGVVEGNGIAYNPAVLYTPPPPRGNPDNLPSSAAILPPSVFTAAPVNGFIAGSDTVDLSNAAAAVTSANHQKGYRPVWEFPPLSSPIGLSDNHEDNAYQTCGVAAGFVAAFYFVYDAATAGCTPRTAATEANDACYTQVTVSATSGTGPAGADERENFANWYSYYRTRNLASKSAAGRAFRGLPTNVRVAGQHLNNPSTAPGTGSDIKFTSTTSSNATNVLKRFCDDPTGTDSLCIDGSAGRSEFFTRLYNSPAGGSTPLRGAMRRAGLSMGTTNSQSWSPYRDVPGGPVSAANPELSCRKNFHIMMTDGYWNSTAGISGDVDSSARTLGDGTAYTPIAPYKDASLRSGTLADNAFEYWYKDLRPDLANNVRATQRDTTGSAAQIYWNPRNNPATWQHMQTFTIGLGIPGRRNPANYFNLALPAGNGDWDEILAGTPLSQYWENPLDAEDGDRIDDLWHAAINSRGDYFAASNPDDLVAAFNQIIGTINAISGSSAGLGATGTSTTTSSGSASLFQVAYETGKWGGKLISKRVDAGGVPDLVNWDAAVDGLNTQNYNTDRHIFTSGPTGVPGNRGLRFRWTDLTAAQQAALNKNPSNVADANGEARLNYLRGASANEGAGLGFRTRPCYPRSTLALALQETAVTSCAANTGKLGDIIDSSPVYVGKPLFDYPDTLESVAYSAFVTAQAGRTPMVYVGANDGMLHGFNSADGKERMAYVPNLVYENISQNNLSLLTSSSYSHRYYVNGTPTTGDVFINGAWRTMLVGGLRKGGRGYYALDVTDPSSFTESAANANQLVKWEFTDPDMGFSFSQASIVKLSTGQWAAVFGNGYRLDNEATGTGRAMIFIVDIDTGNLIRKIDTGVSGGGGTLARPNGMSTPAVIDINDDYIADYIYAGDLFGKMWRIDVRSSTPADWALAANVNPLFTATDSAAVVQPITGQPSVGFHPSGFGGLMVYFGTGKYLENMDGSTAGPQQTQTFYAIYDRGVTGRSTAPSLREPAPIAKTDLLEQTITTAGAVGTFSLRNVSNTPINWRLDRVSTNTHLGWFVNLPDLGERQVTDSLLREGRIIFTTLIPNPDACNPGGTGWLMVLNIENGGQLKETFDTDGDGIFTTADNLGNAYGAAGTKPTGGGSLSTPIVLTTPPGRRGDNPPCKEIVESVDSNGVILPMKITCKPAGRASWRQVR